ncbi:hypothetical protein [Methanobrevibacter sp. DSM 116169]|uniref:hypothetical protein n=1 Tax=Methanobrevibacter sp. DSM 116169 TaxID=3242727 RepID=UPI0038FC7A78
MFDKKIHITLSIMLFLSLILFSISAISAENIENSNYDIQIDENNIIDNEINQDANLNNNVQNFAWLNNEIYKNGTNESTIDLNGDSVIWNDTGLFSNGIEINKTVTIKNGLIDGNNSVRIFKITNSGFLTLENMTLQNGNATGTDPNYFGGAIYNNRGQMTINNTNFIGNTAYTGGAIYNNYGSNFNISNSNFTNNTANFRAGVIYNNYANNLNIINCNFLKNSVIGNSATIQNQQCKNLTVINCNFIENIAKGSKGSGGAITNLYGGNFTVINSNFTKNTAGYLGGAITDEECNWSAINCNFIENNADDSGGAIYNRASVLLMTNCTFIENTANNNGGAIHDIWGSQLIMTGSYFERNSARIGGAILMWGDYYYLVGSLNISSSVFYNNSARENGPEIYIRNGTVDLSSNFWGDNNPNFDNLIYVELSDITYTLDDYIQVKLLIDPNEIYLGDNLTYYLNLIYNNTNTTFSDNLPNILVNIDGDSFIAQNYINEPKSFKPIQVGIGNLTLYYYDTKLDFKEYNVLGKTEVSIGLKDQKYDYGYGKVIGNISIVDESVNVELLINGILNNTNYTDNGEFYFDLSTLPLGTYNITIRFLENSKYLFAESNATLIIQDLKFIYGDIYASENQSFSIEIKPATTGNITLEINKKNYTSNIIDGIATFNLTDLNAGNYNATLYYSGNDLFNEKNESINFNIIKTNVNLTANNTILFYRNGTQYKALLTDLYGNPIIGQKINLTINGVIYNRTTDDKGFVYLNINLDPKVYNISAYFDGSDKYYNASFISLVTVNSTIISKNLVKYYHNGSQFDVTLLDNFGNGLPNVNATFNINGMVYIRTANDKGVVRLNINLDPGNYVITTSFNGLNQSNNITVKSILIGNDLNKTFSESKTYDVLVLDGVGKPLANQNVVININGVFYNISSGNDGLAKLNINLNPGSYIATATWNGYSTSNKIIVSA